MAKSYNWQNIRNLLTEAFTDEELRRFLFESPKFRPVYEQLSQQTGKASIIDLLLEYADRKNLVDSLLLWTREQNPAYYEQCKPYYKHIPYWRALIERLRRQVQGGLNRPVTTSNTLLILLPLFILILLSALLIYHYFYQRPSAWLSSIWPAPPMPDGFNIAVAQFSVTGEAAGQIPADTGWSVADWLARSIEAERIQHPDIMVNEVWGPDKVGGIPGEDHGTRAANAAQFAEDYNVNILIYGIITGSQSKYYFEPEFYVAWHGFDYASEVAGPDQLGQPILLQLPFENPDKNELNNELKARRRVLHHVVYGLGYFYYNNYTEAFEEFDDASREATGEGLEVVHLLKGAAKMSEYNDTNLSVETRLNAFEDAQKAITKTLELNPSYARGHLGLGGIAFQQATALNPQWPNSVDQVKLHEAAEQYLQSLMLATQPDSAYVYIKGNYGLGQIYLTGYHYFPCDWSSKQVQTYFENVITAYKDPPQDIFWFVGKAHSGLAWLAMLTGDRPRATFMLSQCPQNIALLENEWSEVVSSECQQAIGLLEKIRFNRPDDSIADCRTWIASGTTK
ncbi:MAG: hypothetical protein HS126_35515 [Anaerolineales bacterium]|nr:hypothetical protein [Anaerolineales bacterium]